MQKSFYKTKYIRKSIPVNYVNGYKFRRFDQYEINQIKIIQKIWRKYFYLIVNNKIIFIQKIIKGWFVRRLINNILKEIEKLDKFCIIIKITVLYHHIHFNYYKARRNEYNNNHRLTKLFLKLQRRIKKFLIVQKIKYILKTNDLSNLYIIIQKILLINKKNLNNNQIYIRKIKPISKIIMLQKNIRYFLLYKARKLINKSSFNKNYYFKKIIKAYLIQRKPHSHLYPVHQGLNYKVQNKMCFFTKSIIVLKPLLFIQKNYKQRYNYLIESEKITKKLKILKISLNEHAYFTRIVKKNEYPKLKLLQNEIRYFIYRLNSNINLVSKVYLNKCSYTKCYGIGKNKIKSQFYKQLILDYYKIILIHIRKLVMNKLKKLSPRYKKNKTRIEKNTKEKILFALKENPNSFILKNEEPLISMKKKKVTFMEKKNQNNITRKNSEPILQRKYSVSPKKSILKPMQSIFLNTENQSSNNLSILSLTSTYIRTRKRSATTRLQLLKYKK